MQALRKHGKAIWTVALFFWLVCARPAAAQTSAPATIATEHLQLTLLANVTAVNRTGQDFQLGLHFQLQPGWHIYWINAGDSGLPPRVQWSVPAWLPADAIGPLQFPVPHRLPLGPLMDFGYEGALLNLMPCVFPVLFLKGLALVQSSTEERSRLRMHGLFYALGILVSFWIIVALLLLLRAGGAQIGWGFQFQSPEFVSAIALLLFFLGLSLAGQFEIGLSLTSTGGSLARKTGYAGSFFTGVLATVVATPCTAPLMGAAIGYALAQSAGVTGAVFTALALGLAAPYVLLTLQPAWTRLLPKPGAWMEVLKQATAVPIFATTIWLVWVFAKIAGIDATAFLLLAFLLTAMVGWVLGRWPARKVATMLAFVLLVLSLLLPWMAIRKFPAAPANATAIAADGLQWQPYDAQNLDALRAQGKTVFVDFTAAWCLSCQVNERVVLDRADVQQALRSSHATLMRADWTRHEDSITQALAQLGRSGVPTYALFVGEETPTVLPEALTPGIVMDALQAASANVKK